VWKPPPGYITRSTQGPIVSGRKANFLEPAMTKIEVEPIKGDAQHEINRW
jgi:hypothetical protein